MTAAGGQYETSFTGTEQLLEATESEEYCTAARMIHNHKARSKNTILQFSQYLLSNWKLILSSLLQTRQEYHFVSNKCI